MNTGSDYPSGATAGIVTLRDAINGVNAELPYTQNKPGVIHFAISGTPTIALEADLPAIHGAILIDGGTAGVTIDGQGHQIFVIRADATINNLTITGGHALHNPNGTTYAEGGGAINNAGTLYLNNCTITRNTSDDNGGGLENFGGYAFVTNCTFQANTAAGNGGGLVNNDHAILTNCTFQGNTATDNGGAIATEDPYGIGSITSLINCTIGGSTPSKATPLAKTAAASTLTAF